MPIQLNQCRRALRSFIKAYQPDRALMVNAGLEQKIVIDSTPVHFIPGPRLKDELNLEARQTGLAATG